MFYDIQVHKYVNTHTYRFFLKQFIYCLKFLIHLNAVRIFIIVNTFTTAFTILQLYEFKNIYIYP